MGTSGTMPRFFGFCLSLHMQKGGVLIGEFVSKSTVKISIDNAAALIRGAEEKSVPGAVAHSHVGLRAWLV